MFLASVVEELRLAGLLRAVVREREESRPAVQQHIVLSVLVEEGRIDAVLLDEDGFCVWSFRAVRGDHHLAAVDGPGIIQAVGRGDIEPTLVIGNIRRPVSPASLKLVEERPFRIRDRPADNFPVDEVFGMGNGNARKIDERGVDHVEIIPVRQNGRVREEAGADGVFVHFLEGTADFFHEPPVELSAGSPAGEIPGDLIGGHQIPVSGERIHAAALGEIAAADRISGQSSVVQDVPPVVVKDIKARSGIFDDIAEDLEGTDLCGVECERHMLRTDGLVDEVRGECEKTADFGQVFLLNGVLQRRHRVRPPFMEKAA